MAEPLSKLRRKKKAIAVAVLALVIVSMTSCNDYWRDRGQALVNNAQARQQNAKAAIVQAEGSAALDHAQAAALGELVDANTELVSQTVAIASGSNNSGLVAVVLALAALFVFGSMAVAVAAIRRPPVVMPSTPAAPVIDHEPMVRGRLAIHTPMGTVELAQEPGETRSVFLMRVRDTAELLGAQDVRLLPPGH